MFNHSTLCKLWLSQILASHSKKSVHSPIIRKYLHLFIFNKLLVKGKTEGTEALPVLLIVCTFHHSFPKTRDTAF